MREFGLLAQSFLSDACPSQLIFALQSPNLSSLLAIGKFLCCLQCTICHRSRPSVRLSLLFNISYLTGGIVDRIFDEESRVSIFQVSDMEAIEVIIT